MFKLVALASLLAVSFAWENGCGVSKYADAGQLGVSRIVGGQEARPNEFPWQVSMTSLFGSHYCGAIVVSSRWVMTAAHCVYGDSASDLRLVLGDHSRSSSDGPEQIFSVTVLRDHESYNPFTLDNDIALMQVSGSINLNENVAAVCAPDSGDFVGETAVVSGWGTLRSGGPCCPDKLQYVQVPVISNDECKGYYGRNDITPGMICAGDPNNYDSCQGDSGGPLVVKRGGVFQVIGIVSWGIGCASGYPGVYARVNNYFDWIGNL